MKRLIGDRDAGAMREAIEIPMRAARAAADARDLCSQAAPELSGHLAADLAAGDALLSGALSGILACVEANLRMSPDEDVAAQVRSLYGRGLD